jgi:hypothetical protein
MVDENEKKSNPDSSAEQATPQRPPGTKLVVDRVEGEHSAQPSKQDEKPCSNPPKVSKKAEWAHVFVSAILVVITALILRVYSGQLDQMRKSTKAATAAAKAAKNGIALAKESARLDQRAWVTITQSILYKPLAVGEVPKINMTLTNSGKTPALKVRIVGVAYVGDSPVSSSNIGHTGAIKEALIGPGGTISTEREAVEPIRDDDVIQAIKDDTVRLYAMGYISYFDVFNQPHKTNFCIFISGKWLEKSIMVNCDSGNAAD